MLNNIPSLHWVIVHISPRKKFVTCFDGFRQEKHEIYLEDNKYLNILAKELNIREYKDCE